MIHLFDESHQTSHCPKADLTTESPSKGVLSLINPVFLVLVLQATLVRWGGAGGARGYPAGVFVPVR